MHANQTLSGVWQGSCETSHFSKGEEYMAYIWRIYGENLDLPLKFETNFFMLILV